MTTTKMTMGIDQSYTSTGIVIKNDNGDVVHDELIMTTKDKDDYYTNFVRAEEISNKVIEIAVAELVTHVNIEGLGFGATGDATRNLAGLQYLIITKLLNIGLKPTIVAPTSLKKFATGSGKAKKTEVFDAIEAHNPTYFVKLSKVLKTKGRYDLADAYWLAVWDS